MDSKIGFSVRKIFYFHYFKNSDMQFIRKLILQ